MSVVTRLRIWYHWYEMRLAAGFAAQSLSHGGLGAHFYIKNTAVKHLFVNLNEPFGGISKVSYLHIFIVLFEQCI